MITVIEDVLDTKTALFAETTMLGGYFPWYLNLETVTDEVVRDEKLDSPQFTHTFISRDGVKNSTAGDGYLNFLEEKLISINPSYKLSRVKANLNTQSKQMGDNCYPPHTDEDFLCISAIYYVTDSDGDTLFFDKNMNVVQRVTPKRNRLVYFDGSIMHAGTPPKTSFKRCVINFVIKPEESK
jgi:hypothetical protein